MPGETKTIAATGTVYGLIDPRDDETRYIGQTTRALPARLSGHYGGRTSPRVKSWIAELRAAGLRPAIVPLREDVPASDLLEAEREEITRIIAAGGTLLNEQATALGRELLMRRQHEEQAAAEQAAWRQLAAVALARFDGPLPPGELPEVEIPDVAWQFMSKVEPGHAQRVNSLLGGPPGEASEERWRLWRALSREQEEATEKLWWGTRSAWGEVRGLADDSFDHRMEHYFANAAETPCGSRADASRYLTLIVWYMVAVDPWRHLAGIAGLPLDDASFIAWAGQDAGTRDALEFLAARREGILEILSGHPKDSRRRWCEECPGRLLGTVAAVYAGSAPVAAVRTGVVRVLRKLADHHQLTSPMADLLMRLDPAALDAAFGQDITAEMDTELGLPVGTSGRVTRALADRLRHSAGESLRRVADRSAQVLPVAALPHYHGWHGPSVIGARAISGSLVRAGLAEPDGMAAEDYLASVRALWTPRQRGD